MRIISGELGGRRFTPPITKWPTRPTTDIAKEGLFNILQNRLDFGEISMLDLFGGTGNICFEVISRGSESVTYVEKYPAAIQYVKKMAKEFRIESYLNIIRSDVFKYLKNPVTNTFDLIFADPPYDLNRLSELPDLILSNGHLNDGGLLIIEHDSSNNFTDHNKFIEKRKYGETIFSFFGPS